jgi:hypothetical protein
MSAPFATPRKDVQRLTKWLKAHAEDRRRLHLDIAGAAERFGDVAPLDLFDVRLEIKAGRGQ